MSPVKLRMTGARRPLWEGLGVKFDYRVKVSDALREVGADFKVIKAPLFAVTTENGKLKPVAQQGKYAIMRVPDHTSDHYTTFGQCGEDFQIIQRTELASKLDEIALRWPLEAIGEIDGGKTVFILLNAGEMEISGDPVEMFYMLVDTLDGGTSLRSVFTPLRLHCVNALLTALKRATVNVALNHRGSMNRNFDFTASMVAKMADSQAQVIQAFEMMAKYKITSEQALRIMEYIYPMPKTPAKAGLVDLIPEDNSELADIRQQGSDAVEAFEYYANRARLMRDNTAELFEQFNADQPRLAGTTWALYNAVVENADWRAGNGDVDKDALFGARATEKKRAFDAMTKL